MCGAFIAKIAENGYFLKLPHKALNKSCVKDTLVQKNVPLITHKQHSLPTAWLHGLSYKCIQSMFHFLRLLNP